MKTSFGNDPAHSPYSPMGGSSGGFGGFGELAPILELFGNMFGGGGMGGGPERAPGNFNINGGFGGNINGSPVMGPGGPHSPFGGDMHGGPAGGPGGPSGIGQQSIPPLMQWLQFMMQNGGLGGLNRITQTGGEGFNVPGGPTNFLGLGGGFTGTGHLNE